jgi:hypothetical protein
MSTPSHETDSSPDHPFVHVVGCPRSGTYLTVVSLNHLFGIAIPVETHFIPLFGRYKALWGNLARNRNRRRLLDCIYAFLEIWTDLSSRGRNADKIARVSLLITRRDRQNIVDNSDSYATLVQEMFHAYARCKGLAFAGDKSAFFHHVSLASLNRSVPGSKFVHVVRDGRDVWLSWEKTWTRPTSMGMAAKAWAAHVRKKRAWGEKNTAVYYELRYEAFLDDPWKIVSEMAAFLGRPAEQTRLDYYRSEMAENVASKETHPLLSRGIVQSNKEKWRTQMTTRDCRYFEYIAGHALNAFGYETSCRPFSCMEKIRFQTRFLAEQLMSVFSQVTWGRWIKNGLPLVLFVIRGPRLFLPLPVSRFFKTGSKPNPRKER